MRNSRVRRFIHAVPIHLPLFDEWSHWARSKVGRSDLFSLLLISGLLIWSRYADISFDNFYHFMTTSFKLEAIANNHNIGSDKFIESLVNHLPRYSAMIIKHGTATISIVYFLLFMSFLLFSSPIYQLRYLRNKEFTGYSFLVYFIYCWLFISTLSHLPIIHQLVETPLALFPYFYALTVLTVSTINISFRIILNRIFIFHIGTRKRGFEILQSSAFVSLACSTLYANCGNTFEIFEFNASNKRLIQFELDGSALFCQKLFETVALSGNKKYNLIPPVLTMWLTFVSIMVVNYIIEGTATDRSIFFSAKDFHITQYIETEVMIDNKPIEISDKEEEDILSPIRSVAESESTESDNMDNIEGHTIIRRIIHSAEPRDVHQMTSWFAMSTGVVLLDLVIALGIFLDRYDRRELNNSLNALKSIVDKKEMRKKRKKERRASMHSINQTISYLSTPKEHNYISPSQLTDTEQCNTSCFGYLQNETELWFDFMADCGDGFHPSYEIARLLAQPYLIGTNHIKLQRGKLLLIGGDLAYPGPTNANYQNKFFRVFEDAMRPPEEIINNVKQKKPPEISYNKPELPFGDTLESYEGPTCLIIPGNHDWYDGLQTFCRFICNRNWIGGWYLPQTSSYFVHSLPHNWWIFAADYALNGDIDTRQFQYFGKVVETYFDDKVRSERVIIITHQPDWIINDHEGSSYGQNLQYLMNNIIGTDRVRLRLSGDIHNYTRHEAQSVIRSGLKRNMVSKNNNDNTTNTQQKHNNKIYQDIPLQSSSNLRRTQSLNDMNSFMDDNHPSSLIVSGGGGAFLHPTHIPEKKAIRVNGIMYDRVCEYPSLIQSKAYAFFNIFGFRKRNLQFDLMGGCLYYLMVSSLFPLCHLHIESHIEELTFTKILWKFQQIFMESTFEVFERSYISVSVFFLGFFGMYFWTEPHLTVRFRIFIATMHIIAHYIASMTVIIWMEMIIEASLENELIGIKSPYETFQTHFEKTHDILQRIDNNYTFGYMESVLKMLFTVIDITGFHVSLRKTICDSKYKQIGLIFQQLKDIPIEKIIDFDLLPSRFTRFLYHGTAFLFYFIFAAPVVSFIVGLYLFLSAKCGKFNEVFSSLRLDKHKNFVRCHLKYDGSLHLFVIGVDAVPHRWRQDPKWDGRGTLLAIQTNDEDDDADNDSICNRILTPTKKQRQCQDPSESINARDMRYLGASHTWMFPSRWISYNSSGKTNMSSKHDYRRVKIIDQFVLH